MTLEELAKQLTRMESKLDQLLGRASPTGNVLFPVPPRRGYAGPSPPKLPIPPAEPSGRPPPHGPVKIDCRGVLPGEENP